MTTAAIISNMAALEVVLNDNSADAHLRAHAAEALDKNMNTLIKRANAGDEIAKTYLASINRLANGVPATKFVERRADGTGYNIWSDGKIVGLVANIELAFELHPDAEYREEGDEMSR